MNFSLTQLVASSGVLTVVTSTLGCNKTEFQPRINVTSQQPSRHLPVRVNGQEPYISGVSFQRKI